MGIFFWVKTPINGLLCFMLLWSHWFSASLLLKDSPLVELCCWKIWKTYFESLYRKKLVLKVSMFDNFLNFCYKKFLIWCFNIDLPNFCAIQFHKRRIFKVLPMTGLCFAKRHSQNKICTQFSSITIYAFLGGGYQLWRRRRNQRLVLQEMHSWKPRRNVYLPSLWGFQAEKFG